MFQIVIIYILNLSACLEDLRQNVALASVLVMRRHKSIAVICIEMFGNPDYGNIDMIMVILTIRSFDIRKRSIQFGKKQLNG